MGKKEMKTIKKSVKQVFCSVLLKNVIFFILFLKKGRNKLKRVQIWMRPLVWIILVAS